MQHKQAGSAGAARRPAGTAILEGVRVLDLSRLAPGPYGTMLLADLGAEVIVVGGGQGSLPIAAFRRGKRFMRIDLKRPDGLSAFRRLARTADVLMEGYRPGVADRLGIGYADLSAENPGLVYCSLTGYGQDGPLALEAGHDLNYLAISGALGAFGPADNVPAFPLNMLADFAGGGLLAAFGIMAALYERQLSGQGQHLDAAMVDGCMSMMAMHFADWGLPVLEERGTGLVAGAAPFYRCYACADGRFVAVGALERRFFGNLWAGLGYADPPPDHMDRASWPAMTERFEQSFRARSRDAWAELFMGKDACVTAVLAPPEALEHAYCHHRHPDSSAEQAPAVPRFQRTPARPADNDVADQSVEILRSIGCPEAEIAGAVPPEADDAITGMIWPPVR